MDDVKHEEWFPLAYLPAQMREIVFGPKWTSIRADFATSAFDDHF